MPSKSSRNPRPANSRRKPNLISKPKPPLPARTTAPYFVLDTILPSHVVNDRSLFTSYTPSNRIYRTAFGTDIMIEGTGNVEVCVQAGGKSITFTVHDCWHIPSSHHHFLSCLTLTSPTRKGRHQIMLAGRTPRLLFPHKDRLVTPNLPKYVPVAREQGYFVLKFAVPTKIPLPPEPASAPDTRSSSQKPVSLYGSDIGSSCQPFAGLTITRPSSRSSSPQASLSPSPPSEHLSSPSHLTSLDDVELPVRDRHLNSTCYMGTDFASHGGVDALVNTDTPIVLHRGGDAGTYIGSHGASESYAVSTTAYEHHHYHQQQQQQSRCLLFSSVGGYFTDSSTSRQLLVPSMNLSSSDSCQHRQFTTLPPTAPLPTNFSLVQLQHHPQPRLQQHLPYLYPPHHPPPPTVVFPSMMTLPSLIPYYSIPPPRFSPSNHGYQPIQQPGVTLSIGSYLREH